MRKLIVFNHITLDGYFADVNNDMRWANKSASDPEWNAFVTENAGSGGMLVFGRVTYDLMAGFWPTEKAAKMMPVVADRMNKLPKLVFSRTMQQAAWNNTTLIKTDIAAAMRQIKNEPGPDMCILGSGSIVAQLANEKLIDEYQLVINPLALGAGKSLFAGIQRLDLKLTKSRPLNNGNVLLCYQGAN